MISSVSNEKIKYLKRLKDSKYMNEERLFLIEGEHIVKEAYKKGLLKEIILLEDNDIDIDILKTSVSSNVMKSLSNLSSIPTIIGVCNFIEDNNNLGNKIIILDGVQDPGNLGTIIRSAKAFNFDTVVLGLDTVKKYNEKVIRATQGMIFNTNIITRDLSSFIPKLISDNYHVYGTDVVNGTNVIDIDKAGKVAIIMGSEGSGVSNELKSIVKDNIYIEMNEDCESLNVAVATSIIMYEFSK